MATFPPGPGGASAFATASGGKIYALNNLSTAAAQVIAANPTRQSITFHNPGDVDVFVTMASDYSGATLSPTTSALGGTFRIYANGGTLVVTGECQKAWQAFAASGSGKPLTIMESNV